MVSINQVIQGDCRKVLPTFPDGLIDLCVTSPPYWGLRDYGVDNQLGLEDHPQKYINNLVEIFREVKRVLKSEGLLWLNLGDTYYGGGKDQFKSGIETKGKMTTGSFKSASSAKNNIPNKKISSWLQPKQLLLIPSRVAIALQDDGWILRSDVIWHKPNHMPESVRDRFTKSYEHFFMFSKQQKYYFNLNEVRVPHEGEALSKEWNSAKPDKAQGPMDRNGKSQWERNGQEWVANPLGKNPSDVWKDPAKNKNLAEKYNTKYDGKTQYEKYQQRQALARKEGKPHDNALGNPDGKNPGDVWEINTQPFPGSHFAVFPKTLIERIVKCSCPSDGVVLDPFAGSGTALRVARKLGRKFVGIELNPKYVEMCNKRIRSDDYIEWGEEQSSLLEVLEK